MSLSNYKILKNYTKRLDTEHRSDIARVIKTKRIEGINGGALEVGDLTITDGNFTVDQILTDAVTSSSGAGAVATTGSIHEITTTGTGDALTLADGTLGQHLIVVYAAETAGTDTAVLTPTSLLGSSTVTFNSVGDSAHLLYTNSGWVFLGGAAVLA